MDHTTALNYILANCCPYGDSATDEIKVFILEAHCTIFKVTATLKSTMGTIQYDILNVIETNDI